MGDAKLNLPDKEWYTVQDVATRWGCSEADMLHYIQTNKIRPSFMLCEAESEIRNPIARIMEGRESEIGKFSGLASPFDDGWHHGSGLMKYDWKCDLMSVTLSSGQPITIDSNTSEDFAEYVYWVEPIRTYLVHIDDLLVANEELQRFETEYSRKDVSANTSDFNNVEDAANDKDTNQKFSNLNITCNDQSVNLIAHHHPVESDSPPIAEMGQRLDKTTESGKPKHKVSAKGNKGIIKTLILEALKDFSETKNRMPEEGKAFRELLDFIYYRFNSKPKPDYFTKVYGIDKTDTNPKGNCICEMKDKSHMKWRNRKYVQSEFSKHRKEFLLEGGES